MYSNDYRIKHALAIFFAIGIAEELTTLLNISMPILSLVYLVGLLVLVYNFSRLNNGKYIWEPGLGIVGIFALIYLFFYSIGYKADVFEKISSFVSLLVWIKCINYLSNNGEDEVEDEINENNENI